MKWPTCTIMYEKILATIRKSGLYDFIRTAYSQPLELVVTFYVYAHMRKEITFYVFLGEKRDPSEIYANSNLRNMTHITQKPSYVYTFFTSRLKEITA